MFLVPVLLLSCSPTTIAQPFLGPPPPGPPIAASGTLSTLWGVYDPDDHFVVGCAADATWSGTPTDVSCPDCTFTFHVDTLDVADTSTFLCGSWHDWLRMDWDDRGVYIGYTDGGFVSPGLTDEDDPTEINWVGASGSEWIHFSFDSAFDDDVIAWEESWTYTFDYYHLSLTQLDCGVDVIGTPLVAPPAGSAAAGVVPDYPFADLWEVALRTGEELAVAIEAPNIGKVYASVIRPDHCGLTSPELGAVCPSATSCLEASLVAPADGVYQIQVAGVFGDLDAREYTLSIGIDGAAATATLAQSEVWAEAGGGTRSVESLAGMIVIER